MKAAGKRKSSRPVGKLISLSIIAVAVGIAIYVERRNTVFPWTDAVTIDADVVHVAAAVGGRIVDIPVSENILVSKGDLLFQIDPVPYRLAVAQAESDLAIAEAALETQQRVLSTQRSAAKVAAEQVQRAATNLELAKRTVERLTPLAAKGYVPTQQLDQAQTAQNDAETSLQQAHVQEAAAIAAIDTDAAAKATIRARNDRACDADKFAVAAALFTNYFTALRSPAPQPRISDLTAAEHTTVCSADSRWETHPERIRGGILRGAAGLRG
jgi:membrane fusion protein, multidrug efflux system